MATKTKPVTEKRNSGHPMYAALGLVGRRVLGVGDTEDLATAAAIETFAERGVRLDPADVRVVPITHEQAERIAGGTVAMADLGIDAVRCSDQGGFSKEIWLQQPLQSYLSEMVPLFGYVGSHNRTAEQDRGVEAGLRDAGLTPAEIAIFLTWKVGRWLADDLTYIAGAPFAIVRGRIATFLRANGVASTLRQIRSEAAELAAVGLV